MSEKNGPLFTLRMELEGAKFSAARMVSDRNNEIEKLIAETIEQEMEVSKIKEYIKSIAQDEVRRALSEATRRYFDYGPGKTTIYDIARVILDEAFDFAD